MRSAELYNPLRDQPVPGALLDGKVDQGVLIGGDRYDLFMRREVD
jgi:hypothetical protein